MQCRWLAVWLASRIRPGHGGSATTSSRGGSRNGGPDDLLSGFRRYRELERGALALGESSGLVGSRSGLR
jgi:hypothetical protein